MFYLHGYNEYLDFKWKKMYDTLVITIFYRNIKIIRSVLENVPNRYCLIILFDYTGNHFLESGTYFIFLSFISIS